MRIKFMPLGIGLLLVAGSGHAAVFTVTSTAASGTGSLSAAIISANGSAGLDTINFQIAGSGVKILSVPSSGLTGVTDPVVIDGYTQAGAAVNSLTTGASNAVLTIEIDASGMNANEAVIDLFAPATIRGLAIRSYLEQRDGLSVRSGGAGTVVQGCFFGTNAAGLTGGSSSGDAIVLSGQAVIGGTSPADRNLFAGGSNGISLFVGAEGSIIEGNLLGTNAAGTLAQGNFTAILFGNSTVSNVRIGGTTAGSGNVIANSQGAGINLLTPLVVTPGSGHSILGNSIFNNTGLGIDLGGDGLVDPNDPADADSGINNRENAPELYFARLTGGTIQVQGKLDANFTGGTKRIEYFASSASHASGFGEGQVFIGAVNINSGGISVATLRNTISAAGAPALPFFLTATSTAADGSTSEFSNAIPVTDGGTQRNVTNANDLGAGSLRQAMLDANGNAGIDTIAFNIGGNGPHVIALASALPSLSNSVVIDGYSQPFSHNNNLSGIGSDADLRIVLDGTGAGSSNGLSLTGGSSVIRGLVIQNFGNLGIAITGGSAHRIEGNFIGTDVAGTLDRGNAGNGISINPAVGGVQIGGAPAFRNLISGNNGAGISPSGSPANIQNNLIGTTRDGSSPLGNSFAGITTGASGITIDSNRIRSNGSVGVLVFGTGQVEILGNGIANNTSRGIDLNNDGVTLNDANDVDSGPNGLQNFPVLSKVEQGSGGVLRVEGSLDRPAGAAAFSYVLEFFSNSACDGSHGEGETPLFSSTVNFASGSAETFAVNGTGLALAAGTVVTATATDANGNTSEFSACFNSTLQPDSIFANRFE